MLICIDLSRLYFAVRSLNVSIDYEALLDLLEQRASGDVDVVGFTIADPGNAKQAKFIERLNDMDVEVKCYPADSNPSFTPEIAAEAARYDMDDVLVVSNDQNLIRVFDLLKEGGKRPQLCFFSDRLDSAWNPLIISGEVPFVDLSDPAVRRVISR
jgi:hypothetical protein